MSTDNHEEQRHEYPPTERLTFDFAKLTAVKEANEGDPRLVILKAYVELVFIERYGREPKPGESITLRHADDLAVAAMFGVEYPQITQKTHDVVERLGLVPDSVAQE